MRGISIFVTLHAISGQRYHDNTPAVAAMEPDAVGRELVSSPDSAASLWHVRGEKKKKGRDGRKKSYTRPVDNDNKETNAETPQSKRSVALGRHSSFARIVLASTHNGTKACSSLLLSAA